MVLFTETVNEDTFSEVEWGSNTEFSFFFLGNETKSVFDLSFSRWGNGDDETVDSCV